MYFYGKKKKKNQSSGGGGGAPSLWEYTGRELNVPVLSVVPSIHCGFKVGTVSQGSDQASRILSSYLGDGSFLCGWSSQIAPQQNVPVSRSFLLSANLE